MPHSLIVLDASAALALILAEDEGTEVEEILNATISINGQIFVPGLFWYELGNALLTAERKNRIDRPSNTTAISGFARLPIVTHQESDFAIHNRIMGLARETGLTYYDASYLELAMRYEAPLKSFDTHIINLKASFALII
jgi:predicted nucleic acid-binding protein